VKKQTFPHQFSYTSPISNTGYQLSFSGMCNVMLEHTSLVLNTGGLVQQPPASNLMTAQDPYPGLGKVVGDFNCGYCSNQWTSLNINGPNGITQQCRRCNNSATAHTQRFLNVNAGNRLSLSDVSMGIVVNKV
jgi:hypothetical protein